MNRKDEISKALEEIIELKYLTNSIVYDIVDDKEAYSKKVSQVYSKCTDDDIIENLDIIRTCSKQLIKEYLSDIVINSHEEKKKEFNQLMNASIDETISKIIKEINDINHRDFIEYLKDTLNKEK